MTPLGVGSLLHTGLLAGVSLFTSPEPVEALDLVGPAPLVVEDDREAADRALPCGAFAEAAPRLTLEDDLWLVRPEAVVVTTSHTEKSGEVVTYEQIPRRWDRPAEYEAYRYPVARYLGWPAVASGYDLDLPDDRQRRGATLRATGHGGVDLPQAMGAPITLLPLAQQIGDAEVLYVGPLFGTSVVTLHALREGDDRRHYILIYGHMSEPAPSLRRGQRLAPGELVGSVGDSESPSFVHVHLEARRVRDGVDPGKLTPDVLLSKTVVTDPRNVLPLRPPATTSSCRDRGLAKRARLPGFSLERPAATWISAPDLARL